MCEKQITSAVFRDFVSCPDPDFFFYEEKGESEGYLVCQVWGSGDRGAMVGFHVDFGNLTNI